MKNPRIVIIDYGVGNTYSVSNAIDSLGYRRLRISDKEEEIDNADVLILPGVGAFKACVNNLKERNLVSILNKQVLIKKKPILGICVGMQLLASFSEENGVHEGLGWIPGNVQKLQLPEQFAIPHVGWNNVVMKNNCPIFNHNTPDSNFYFDHSYFFNCDEKYVVGYCNYGFKVTAAVQHENIFGVQFHPEKSQTSGLKLFRGFLNSI
jgi:glutamine amidotransferase